MQSDPPSSSVHAAAAGFAQDLGLRLRDQASKAEGPSTEEARRLLEVLRVRDTTSLDWWTEVGECWLDLGYYELVRACLDNARSILEDGATTGVATLARLGAMRAAVTGSPPSDRAADELSHNLIAPESINDKEERLRGLLGIGDRDSTTRLIEEYSRQRDLEAAILFATSGQNAGIKKDSSAFVKLWLNAGEPAAAIEEFLFLLNSRGLHDIMVHLHTVAVLGGQALHQVGDPVTAFACFRVVAHLHRPEMRDSGTRTQGPEDQAARLALEEEERLHWANALLDTTENCFWLSPSGSRVGQWLIEHGLAGRWLTAAGRSLIRLHPVTTANRQLRMMAVRCGWNPIMLSSEIESRRPPSRLSRVTGAPPGRLAFTERVHGNKRSWAKRLFRYVEQPTRLVGASVGDSSCRLHIGYSFEKQTQRAYASVGRGWPLFCVGKECDDDLATSLARQLAEQGMRVLWFREAVEGRCEGSPADEWLHLRPADAPEPAIVQWLQDLSASGDLRRTVSTVLREILPPCRDGRAQKCLDALLASLTEGEVWSALSTADDSQRSRIAVKIVGHYADLEFKQPIDLRRAAVLVNHVFAALAALRSSIAYQWTKESGAIDSPRGIVFDLSSERAQFSGLSSLLAVGSLFSSYQSRSIKDVDDFSLVIRKRKQSSDPDYPKGSDIERLLGHLTSTASTAPSRDFWGESSFLSVQADEKLAVLVSCSLGPAVNCLFDMLAHNFIGKEHFLIVCIEDWSLAPIVSKNLGHCREILCGTQSSIEDVETLEVASGTPLSLGSSSEPFVELLSFNEKGVERERIILWPPGG